MTSHSTSRLSSPGILEQVRGPPPFQSLTSQVRGGPGAGGRRVPTPRSGTAQLAPPGRLSAPNLRPEEEGNLKGLRWAGAHVPILRATRSCLWEGGLLRPGQPEPREGAQLVPHPARPAGGAVQAGVGAKESQRLSPGHGTAPPGGSSGSCHPPSLLLPRHLPAPAGRPWSRGERSSPLAGLPVWDVLLSSEDTAGQERAGGLGRDWGTRSSPVTVEGRTGGVLVGLHGL